MKIQQKASIAVLGLLALGVVALAANTGFASKAYAQPVTGAPPGMQQVSGKYTDSSVGLEITLPDGWSGIQLPATSGVSMAMAAPGGFSSMDQSNGTGMYISVTDKKPINATFQNPASMRSSSSSGTQQSDCSQASYSKTTVNGMNAAVITVQCTGTSPFKGKGYIFQTDAKNIMVLFGSASAPNFDKYVSQFDSSVNTLKIANTVDVSVPVPEFPISAVFGIAAVVGVIAVMGRFKGFRGTS
ncbi:MAG: hypothetical protein ABI361_06095 [Nitrososphaera sp.]